MGFFQSLRFVVLPQTISIVLPPVLNDLIYMFKDSSLLSVITIIELTAQTTGLGRRYPVNYWQFIFIGGLIYLALSLPLARFARVAEGRLRSTSFVPRGNLTVTLLQVLGVSIVVGLVASILVDPAGISLNTLVNNIGQFFAAVALCLMIILFILLVLGGIVTIPAALLGRGAPTDRPRVTANELQPAAVASK